MLKFVVIFILFNAHNDSTDTLRVYQISSYLSFISNCTLFNLLNDQVCDENTTLCILEKLNVQCGDEWVICIHAYV